MQMPKSSALKRFKKSLLLASLVAACFLLAQSHALSGQSVPAFTELGYPRHTADFLPWSIAIADFNHDGIPDIAVANNEALSGTETIAVAIYLGRGDGSFQIPVTYSVPQQLAPKGFQALIAADFNGDGKVDLCVAADDFNSQGSLMVLAGNGDGTFQSPIVSSMGTTPLVNALNLATADFNGDGKPDVVLSTATINTKTGVIGSPEILFFAGNGDGTFAAPVAIAEPDGGGSIAVADLNHDGKPDIAWLGSGVNVALGDGNGGFSAATQYAGSNPYHYAGILAIADFNSDGQPDILTDTAIGNQTSFNVYPGNGDGTFGTVINTPITSGEATALEVAVADFDGDGHLDLFVGGTNASNSTPNLFLHGNGDGTFTVSTANIAFGSVTPEAWFSTAADLNGDGTPDIAFVDPNLMLGILLNTPANAPIALSPASYSFGYQTIGATGGTETFTIGNTGASALAIGSLTLDNTTDFSMTNTCGASIPAQSSCSATVTFQPQSAGAKTANLNISGSSISAAATAIHIFGQAIAPALSATPVALAFSYQKVGTTSASQALQVQNSGIGPLTFSSIQTSQDFQQTNNCPATLAQGASCTVTVVYAPEVPGSETGRVIFNTNAVPAQIAVPLTGIGYILGPVLGISPTSLSFGNQYVGTSSAPGVVTVQNTGDAPFSIASIATTTGFVPLSTCGNSVQPSSSCAIGVFFDPVTTGDQTGALTVTTNLASPTTMVALQGTGTSITVTPASTSSTSATVAAGQSATYNMNITAQAGYTGTVNLSCTGLPAGFNCSLSQNSATLTGSTASASVTVTVTATAQSSATSRKSSLFPGAGLLTLACPLIMFLFPLAHAQSGVGTC